MGRLCLFLIFAIIVCASLAIRVVLTTLDRWSRPLCP